MEEMGLHEVGLSGISARFWTLTLLLVLPDVTPLSVPTNVTLNSDHFGFILKWEPGPGTPTRTYYRVSIGTTRVFPYLQPVSNCQHVQPPLICNVTEAILNPWENYSVKVSAHHQSLESEQATTLEFKPIDHVDLPLLTVTPCGRELCVDLHPPLGHRRETYNLNYQLKIRTNNKDSAQFLKDGKFLGRETLKDLAPGRQYCVSVRFADELEKKMSNFSQPVCAFTSGFFPTDPVISAAVCLLLITGVVLSVLLACTGYIHLKKIQLPSVLSTIDHVEEVLVIPSCSVLSFQNVWPISPSAEDKACRLSSSDESDEDCASESVGGTNNRAYQQRMDTYLLASSSSLLVSPSSKPKVLPRYSPNHLADFCSSQFITEFLTEGCLTVRPFQEGEILIKEKAGQDVNLHTLTFGRQGDVESLHDTDVDSLHDTPEVDSLDASEDITPVPSSQTVTNWSVDEEEEEMETSSGYMERSHANAC